MRNRLALAVWLWTSACFGNELHGLWVDAFGPGFQDRKQVKQLVNDCRKYNFNAIFVQMRKRGDAFYFPKAPNEDPRNEGIATDFDALQEIINQCHTGEPRIEVHCWVVGYFIWAWDKPPRQKQHLFNAHPEWLTRDFIGQKMIGQGYYVDPGNPEANLALLNTAKDIASHYEIDGLHWDYLRYPLQDSGYNPIALKRYQEEFMITKKPEPEDPKFSEWRRRQVTDFTRWSTAELLAINPKLVISASVFSNYKDSRDIRFQDWAAWDKEGILDATVPMDFSKDNRFIFNPRADFAVSNQWNRTIWIGQGAYMNNVENTLKQLQYCRSKGFSGTLFYSYRNPNEESKSVVSNHSDESEQEEKSGSAQTIVDNREAEVVGLWKTGEYGKMHGEDYLFINKGRDEAFVKFSAKLPASGEYWVCEWHVAGKNRAEAAPHTIKHRDGETKVNVDQKKNGSRWNLLGKFNFETNGPMDVRISNIAGRSNDVIVADAVRFVLADGSSPDSSNDDAAKAKAAEQARRLNQQTALAFIRDKFQPSWESSPTLVWKKDKGIIKGNVFASDGKPIYNATVRIIDLPQMTQKTEPHGAFAFFEVLPGEYDLEVLAPDRERLRKKINVKAGEAATAIFTFLKINPHDN